MEMGKMTAKVIAIVGIVLGLSVGGALAAQDIAAAHPKNVKVEFENAQVRVMRVTLGAHKKLDLHETRDLVVVPLTDYVVVHKDTSGKTAEVQRKTGKAVWLAGGEREVEAGDKPVEAILVELKAPAPAK
jgi:hypothetical protein